MAHGLGPKATNDSEQHGNTTMAGDGDEDHRKAINGKMTHETGWEISTDRGE
jgi:hypothetical protein